MKRDTTEQTVAWYALTQPMVRTANQTATVYSMIVIIETDAIVQEDVIRSHLTRTYILINKSKIENKSKINLHGFKLKCFNLFKPCILKIIFLLLIFKWGKKI